MLHISGRLLQGPREMRERGGGGHQQAQNVHAAGIRQELDLVKRLNGLNFLHNQLRKNLIVSLREICRYVKPDFYLT